jgi:hypothetical protein
MGDFLARPLGEEPPGPVGALATLFGVVGLSVRRIGLFALKWHDADPLGPQLPMFAAGREQRGTVGIADQSHLDTQGEQRPGEKQRTRWAIGLGRPTFFSGDNKTGHNRNRRGMGRQVLGCCSKLPRTDLPPRGLERRQPTPARIAADGLLQLLPRQSGVKW